MTTQEILSVIANFAEHGVKTITLLGGEVTTERRDLREILQDCSDRGMQVSINTNLVDLSQLLPLLSVEALVNVVVSLDGISPSTHDKVRGTGTFAKTSANLAVLSKHPRVRRKSLALDLTFVLTGFNKKDIFALPGFCKAHSINKLNFKTLQLNDRAVTNRRQLQLSEKELLDTCTAFYVYCLLEGGINLDMHIPPAFGYYLNKVATTPEYLWNFESCGGTGVYTYVDLYGNNLPCPAMSLEENTKSNLRKRSASLNAVTNSVAEIHTRSIFQGFDRSVERRHRNRNMEPCRECVFSDRCSPCTNEIIRGQPAGRVDICAAVRKHGSERFAGLSEEIFRSGSAEAPAKAIA